MEQIVITEKPLSFEIFKKTPEEKVALKNAKSAYKKWCKTNGIKP